MKNYFSKIIFFLITSFYTLVYCAKGKDEQPKAKPNIVIILADDMGYGDLSCQNPNSKIQTPFLDQLAKDGIRFTDAHSSSGICTPSRYALLTGRYHWRKFHDITNSFDESRFDEDEFTLPLMLKEKNYKTAMFGKWHLGWNWNEIRNPNPTIKTDPVSGRTFYAPDAFDWSKPVPGGPTDHGFDYYFGDDVVNFPPYTWFENNKILITPTEDMDLGNLQTSEGTWEFRKGPMVKDWDPYHELPLLTKKTVEWISNQKKEEPFFLYFALPSPHAPIIPNEEFVGKSNAGGYGDYVFQTDWIVGEVLKALEKNGLSENTIVIFTSDNGPEKYAFDRVQNFEHKSMGDLRGLKRDIWEGGHRIPMIIKWPGNIKAGVVSNALMSQIDIMSTIANIVGVNLPEYSADDSFNQLPVWLGEGNTVSTREVIVHNTFEGEYAVRRGDWVFVDVKTGVGKLMPDWYMKMNNYEEDLLGGGLYNLKDDLAQRKNMVTEYPQKVAELRQLLKNIQGKGQRFSSK